MVFLKYEIKSIFSCHFVFIELWYLCSFAAWPKILLDRIDSFMEFKSDTPYHSHKINDIPAHQSSNWNLSLIAPYHSHKICDILAHVRPYNRHMISFLTFELIIKFFLDIICWGDLLNLLITC